MAKVHNFSPISKMLTFCMWPCLLASFFFSTSYVHVSGDNMNGKRECGSFEAVQDLPNSVTFELFTASVKIKHNPSLLEENGAMASLHKSLTNFGSSTHICGAVLISPFYLLTAAHCVNGSNSQYSVRLGAEDLDKDPDSRKNVYFIEEIFIHPGYGKSKNKYNDLAIMKTKSIVKYNGRIWPYCLPDRNQIYVKNLPVQIAGYGQVNEVSVNSPSIQSAFVYLLEDSECESVLQDIPSGYYDRIMISYPQGITKKLICALRKGVDACNGDSGGAMSFLDPDDRRVVIGIISDGISRCPERPETPGFYVNLQEYLDWIAEITGTRQPRHIESDGINIESDGIWSSLRGALERFRNTMKTLYHIFYFLTIGFRA